MAITLSGIDGTDAGSIRRTCRSTANLVRFRAAVAFLVLAVFTVAPAIAQITRGSISGIVRDTSGAVIAGAAVTVTSSATDVRRSTTTDGAGLYRVGALEPGRYTVKTELPSFTAVEIIGLDVTAANDLRVDAELKPAAVAESVTVSGTSVAGDLNNGNPTIGLTLSSREVVDLPLPNGRDLNRLILAAPNTSYSNGQGTYTINGQRSRNNNYMVDGSDNNDVTVTLSASQLVPEGVAEYQLLTNPYNVEFGRNSGGQINVITKSGTNQFHGDLWDYPTLNNFGTLNNIERASGLTKPTRFNEHQVGGNFGGPLLKDRAFFFALFQYDPQRPGPTPGSTVRVPTPAGYARLQNLPLGAAESAASRQAVLERLSFLTDVYATGTSFRNLSPTLVNGVPIETGETNVSIVSPSTSRALQVRVDHKLTNHDGLMVRELYTPRIDDNITSLDNCVFGQLFCAKQDLKDHNIAVSETHVFNTEMLNEFRFSLVRRDLAFPEYDPSSPTATITGLFTLGGLNSFPQSRVSRAYQFSDVFAWTRARHTIRAGADIRYNKMDNVAGFDSKGTFTFNSLQDFLNNFAAQYQQALQTASWRATQWQNFLFVQDDFRVSPELTMNLGVRYEISTIPLGMFGATDPQSLAALVPGPVKIDKDNWAPRVGAAYNPRSSNRIIGDRKSVFRGGFGVAYDVLFYNLLVVNASNYPRIVVPQQFNVQDVYPNVLPLAGAAVFDPLAAYTNSVENTQNPESRYYSASWQRKIGEVVIEAGYAGSRTAKGLNQGELNPAVLTVDQAARVRATKDVDAIPGVQARRLFPQFGSRVVIPTYTGQNGVDAEARSTYNAVFLSANKRYSRGVQLGGSYTYSRYYSNNDAALSEGGTAQSSQRPQSAFDIAAEWSRSTFDRPHRFTMNYIWEIPGPKAGVLGYMFGGWQVTGITQAQSGQPFTILTGVDSNGDGSIGSDRPNIDPTGTIIWDSDHKGFVNNGYYVAPLGLNGLPLANALGNGNAPRNSERAAPFWRTDLSFQKRFDILKRSVRIRTDLLNAFKQADFGVPVNNMSSPSFGQNTNNWQNRRTIQLNAKVTF